MPARRGKPSTSASASPSSASARTSEDDRADSNVSDDSSSERARKTPGKAKANKSRSGTRPSAVKGNDVAQSREGEGDGQDDDDGGDDREGSARGDEATTVGTTTTTQGRGMKSAPRDAIVIREILRTMGVTDVEQKVINQGMEFMHRYTSEVLEEASIASAHAKKTTLDVDDVKMGAKAILLTQFFDPPSLGDAHAMANVVNKHALPKLSERPGIHVPTEMNLLSDNYDIGPPRAHEIAANLEREAEARAAAAAAAAAAAIAASAKVTAPSAIGAHAPMAFEVKAKASAEEPVVADVGDFAEFMMDDDDDMDT